MGVVDALYKATEQLRAKTRYDKVLQNRMRSYVVDAAGQSLPDDVDVEMIELAEGIDP